MKISILGTRGIPARYSGIETTLEEIAKRLALRNHKITVYCTKKNPYMNKIHENITLIYIPTLNTKHLNTFFATLLSTFNVLFSDADIIHFHSLGPSIFSFLPRIFGKKTLVTIHALDWKRKKWGIFARNILKLCEYAAVYFPNRTITVSKVLKRYFENKFRRKLIYIPNGVSLLIDDESLSNYKLYDKYILFLGRLTPEKGIHYLIEAFKELKSDMKLIIAGEGSFADSYVSNLKRMACENIEFVGFVEGKERNYLYANAYIFVLPSEVEGMPVSILEAMSFGKCVLVSDIEECLEVVGNYGVTFKSGSREDLKNKLQYLIDNPTVVKETGLRAQRYVIERYGWDKIIKQIEDLYYCMQEKQ